MQLFADLELLNNYCTSTLACIDPLQFGLLKRVYDHRLSNYKSQAAFAALDRRNLWEGREVMFNRWSPDHRDQQDPHWAWACIVYFGNFTNAHFRFPELGLEIRLQPGDVVFFRGRDLLHGVPEWESGDRHFVVTFTHEAMWKEADVECASSKDL